MPKRRRMRPFVRVLVIAAVGLVVWGGGCLAWTIYQILTPSPHPPGYDELMAAVERKDASAVERILAKGVDPNAYPYSDWARMREEDFRVINIAASNGDPRIVKLLLNAGADPNRGDGWYSSPLAAATEGNHLEAMKVLIAGGAKVNDSRQGSSALWRAAMDGKATSVKFLLAHGANPNTNYGNGTLTKFLSEESLSRPMIARMLKEAGGR